MKDKIKEFFKKNGYAAAIYSCVALVVVMAAGVALYDNVENRAESGSYGEEAVNNSKDKRYKEETTQGTTAKTAEATTEAVTSKTAEKATEATTQAASKTADTNSASGSSDKKNEAETETKKTASAEELFSFDENTQIMLMPVEGEIVMEYSPEIAVFDATLEQYRTNDTICIAGEEGTPVAATADGVVMKRVMTK